MPPPQILSVEQSAEGSICCESRERWPLRRKKNPKFVRILGCTPTYEGYLDKFWKNHKFCMDPHGTVHLKFGGEGGTVPSKSLGGGRF